MPDGGKERLVEVAESEVVFVEAEEVAKFMEIGSADLFGKDVGISFGKIPEIVQIKNDPRRRIGGGRVGLQPAGAFEQPQQIRLEPLVENGRIRDRLVQGYD